MDNDQQAFIETYIDNVQGAFSGRSVDRRSIHAIEKATLKRASEREQCRFHMHLTKFCHIERRFAFCERGSGNRETVRTFCDPYQ
jgi:hypothetical protein